MRAWIALLSLALLSFNTLAAESLMISDGSQKLTIPYWRAKEHAQGAVLILQGAIAPRSARFLDNLARNLQQLGWSVAMINQDGSLSNPVQILPAAISALRQKKNNRVILIHYGLNLQGTMDYFSQPKGKQVNGLVMISGMASNHALTIPARPLRFPVFDIIGQFDYDPVLNEFKQRTQQGRKLSQAYHAMVLPGAYHDYHDDSLMLANYLNGWMSKLNSVQPTIIPNSM